MPGGTNKRKRISQACDFCRNRHLKCDGEKQCYQCQSRDITCVYSPKKRRGPKPKGDKKKKKQKLNDVDNDDIVVDRFPNLFWSMMKQFCCGKGPTWIEMDGDKLPEFYVYLKKRNFKDATDEYLTEAFYHGVVFSFGAQILGEKSVSAVFAEISLKLFLKLVMKHKIYESEISGTPKFLEFVILLANYYQYILDFSKCRTVMSQALALTEMKEYPADLCVRVYSYMMSGASSAAEKLKWFDIANSLSGNLTIFGRLNLLVMLPMDMDKSQRFLTSQNFGQNKPLEIKFIRGAIQFIDSTEDILSHLLSLGTLKSNKVLAFCKSIIYGTRAIVYAKLGLNEIALSWSNETANCSRSIQLEIDHLSRISLIYSVAASLYSGTTSIYESFLATSGHLKDQWPIFTVLHSCLQDFQKMVAIPQSTSMTLLHNQTPEPMLKQEPRVLYTGNALENAKTLSQPQIQVDENLQKSREKLSLSLSKETNTTSPYELSNNNSDVYI
eukprot:TRINITY_DN550_c0_g3_i1.p1 TRINITY_DN550_c0_g3~~TRINITY_DN550_c0_g3_i1.p1  ORF type:complete len:498 (-),score=72.92 TRINITY_DN550_c0_g3_i1:73-1566(-)